MERRREGERRRGEGGQREGRGRGQRGEREGRGRGRRGEGEGRERRKAEKGKEGGREGEDLFLSLSLSLFPSSLSFSLSLSLSLPLSLSLSRILPFAPALSTQVGEEREREREEKARESERETEREREGEREKQARGDLDDVCRTTIPPNTLSNRNQPRLNWGIPVSARDQRPGPETRSPSVRAPRTPRYQEQATALRHVRNKRRNHRPLPAAVGNSAVRGGTAPKDQEQESELLL